MKYFFIFIASFIFLSQLEAQTIEVSGTIIDSATNQSLSYGNIILKNSKDSIIGGVLSNETGDFKIKKVEYQDGIYLYIKYLGYEDKKVNIPYNNNPKVELNKIFLKHNVNEIETATIVGKTNYMEQKFDRKVFNISEAKTTAAKNIFDLLRTLPGVVVDESDNVKYKGVPADIYIDDQPAQYVYPKTEMIPVASVIKIELIDASLRSGAGKGGIINIKMKNLATDGLSGMAQINSSSYHFKAIDESSDFLNLNYKIKKIIVFFNMDYDYYNKYGNSTTDGSLNFSNTSFDLLSKNEFKNKYNDLWSYGGLRYSPDINTRIRFSSGMYTGNGSYPNSNYTQQNIYHSDSILEKYSVFNDCDYNNNSKWFNTSYYHSFDSLGKELVIYTGMQLQRNNNDNINDYNYQVISQISMDSSYSNEVNYKWAQSGLWGGFYYNNPLNNKTRWNCGWSGWFAFKQKTDNIISENNIINLPLSSYTQDKSQDQSAYFRFGTTLKKWKLDAGISAQYDNNNANYTRYPNGSNDTLLVIKKDYLKFLPSATIVYSLDSLEEFKITYSKSIESLWYDQLCDYIDKSGIYSWSVGNSKLKPVSYNNFYLGYSYSKNFWNFNADIFYSITSNAISYLTFPVTNVITLTIPENVAHNESSGIDLSSWISLKEKYDFNLSSSIYHTYINASGLKIDTLGSSLPNSSLKKKDYGFNVKFSADIKIGEKLSTSFYVNYFSREITFEGYNFDYVNSAISLTKKFFNRKLLLTIGVNNIFDNIMKHGSYYNYGGITRTTNDTMTKFIPTYFITMQYKFRQGDRGTKDAGKAMK
jgi:hypothetical protein